MVTPKPLNAGTGGVPFVLPEYDPLERVNKEIERRTNVVGTFTSEAAIMRLSGAALFENSRRVATPPQPV